MKKEELLLVFDFLATDLKQDVVEEQQVEPVREIYEDYNYDGNFLTKKVKPEPEKTEEIQEPVEIAKPSIDNWHEDFIKNKHINRSITR